MGPCCDRIDEPRSRSPFELPYTTTIAPAAHTASSAEILAGYADDEVVEAVAVQVARGEGRAEEVAGPGTSGDIAGRDQLVTLSQGAVPRAVEHVDRARVAQTVQVLAGGADDDVVAAVTVEVAVGDRAAEPVVLLADAPETALGRLDAPQPRDPTRRAAEHVDQAGGGSESQPLVGHPDHQLVATVAVEVAGSTCGGRHCHHHRRHREHRDGGHPPSASTTDGTGDGEDHRPTLGSPGPPLTSVHHRWRRCAHRGRSDQR
jgi:hypothetical protein